ncbi:hypothetical protein G5I_13859 [Acromyrmex echinatior]|uniref:DUF8207 domain-containing protein n=1 Tax=Acromyrmex echinatior TaxID=103372 RepID=F4X656_ACREC|nr:hypothetical protein G5I_13859 [Acromyrmex echinatior]
MNMADVREREKIAKEIEKTSESIYKKHRALKNDRIEEDMALDRHFKPIIKRRQIVDSLAMRAIKRQSRDDDAASVTKRERKKKEEEEEEREKASETKRFDVDDADNIIIDGIRYASIPGLYELISKRILDLLYTEDNMNKYKNMLLAMNAHKHKHRSQVLLLSNREYKVTEAGDSRDFGRITPSHRREEEKERPGLGVRRRLLLTDPSRAHDT